jgi:hypothetical protein
LVFITVLEVFTTRYWLMPYTDWRKNNACFFFICSEKNACFFNGSKKNACFKMGSKKERMFLKWVVKLRHSVQTRLRFVL